MKSGSVIYLLAAFQALILALVYFIKARPNKYINPYYLLFMFTLSLACFSKYSFTQERFLLFPKFWFAIDTLFFVIVPFWYLSLRKGASNDKLIPTIDWIGLLPTLYQLGFLIFISQLDNGSLIQFSTSEDSRLSFFLFSLCAAITNIWFIVRSYYFTQSIHHLIVPRFLQLTQVFILALIIVWLTTTIVFTILAVEYGLSLKAYDAAFFCLAFSLLILSFVSFLHPNEYQLILKPFSKNESDFLKKLAKNVINEIEEKGLYLNPEISINTIALTVNESKNNCSKALNEVIGKNFNEVINEYRLAHFLKIAIKAENLTFTLVALAEESGFNNKVTFYQTFKKKYGTSPKKYLKKMSASSD